MKNTLQGLTRFVGRIPTGLTIDDLKKHVREILREEFHHVNTALNIYWTRGTCGVRVKDAEGVRRDVYFFTFAKCGGTKTQQLLISVGAAAFFVTWLAT